MNQAALATELDEAIELLKDRLSRRLVAELEQGDFAENLLTYLRQRVTPKLLFTPANATKIIQRCAALDPDEFAWEKRIADEAVQGRVYAASNPYCDRFVELDRDTFDFSQFDHWDKEALHGLNRHRWYAALARHYWEARDESYFDALMREWDFYAEKVPSPDDAMLARIHSMGPGGMRPPYAELDTYIRLTNWWWAYWLALHAEPMTAERNAVLLARCLRLFDRAAAAGFRRHEHNFTSMQMEAIYLWSTALPEATGMNVWRHAARNFLEASLKRATADDGSHWEQSIGYHGGCIRWYGTPALLAQRNDEPFADEYVERLVAMGDFLDGVLTPDEHMPLLSDSDRTQGWLGAMALIKCLSPGRAFVHEAGPSYMSLWLSDGLEWTPGEKPNALPTMRAFPHAGIAVARHPSRRQGSMLLLDNGPNLAGHAHMDNLTLHYEALGRPVIVDPGRWIYTRRPDRSWVLQTHSHNTIFIEPTPLAPGDQLSEPLIQTIAATDDPRVSPIAHDERDGMVRLQTTFRGYTPDPDARAQRTVWLPTEGEASWLVVLDRFEASEAQSWTNSWLLPTEQALRKVDGGYTAALENGLMLSIALASSETVELRDDAMFWCPNYAEKSPARWARFSASAAQGRRAFAFVPGETEAPMPTVAFDGEAVRLTLAGETFTCRA